MRVLHVTQGYSPAIGGTERLVQRVSEELVQRWHDDVAVLTTDCYSGDAFYTPNLPSIPGEWSNLNGVQIRRLPVRRQLSRMFRRPQALAYRLGLPFNDRLRALAGGPIVPGLRKAIASTTADVIVAASFPLLHMFDALAAARATCRPCVLIGCLHPDDRWGFERPMIYDAIREADAYIALTTHEAAHVVARGANPDRVHAIGVGVDARAFQGFSSEEARWRLGFDRRPVIGFIGQLAQHKGIDTLLRAMPAVWRYEPEVNLLIAGGRTLFADRVEQIVRDWPDNFRRRTRIHLGFPEEQKPELFAAIDVLVCPSAFESFGITYLEAWAAGKPVIGARAGAVPTVIDEGTDGLLIQYDDDLALAREVVDLVREPLRAARMGAAGRAKALARHAWPLIADEYRRVYAEAVKRAPRPTADLA
jgi:glycosyltransferase involved in cell wall biosynthesis